MKEEKMKASDIVSRDVATVSCKGYDLRSRSSCSIAASAGSPSSMRRGGSSAW
jgi:hypothetical protein